MTKSIGEIVDGTTTYEYDYASDAIARRSSVINSGQAFSADAFNLYDYDDRNEVTESARAGEMRRVMGEKAKEITTEDIEKNEGEPLSGLPGRPQRAAPTNP